MTTRRALRARLVWIGQQPAVAPSTAFVAGLERRLLDTAARGVGAAAPAGVRERLAWLGDQPVAGPSPEFVAGLERRLVGSRPSAGNRVLLPARCRTVARVVAAAAAAVVLVAARRCSAPSRAAAGRCSSATR